MSDVLSDFKKALQDAVAEAGQKSGTDIVKAVQDKIEATFPVMHRGELAFPKSPALQFVESEAYKMYSKDESMKHSAKVQVEHPDYSIGPTDRWEPASKGGYATKANEAVSSLFLVPPRTLPPQLMPQRTGRVRDLLPVAGIDTPSIQYTRVTGLSNQAASVVELATKPQSWITTENVSAGSVLIATFIPVTRQAIRRHAFLRNYLENVLTYFLSLEEDRQLLQGAGGNDLTGLLNTVGVNSLDLSSLSVNQLDGIRMAVTDIQTAMQFSAGFQPTGVIMHPNDWEDVELEKYTEDTGGTPKLTNQYLLMPAGAAPSGVPQNLWRLPVIVTPAMPEGTRLVGAFDIGAQFFIYTPLQMFATDSHSDWFAKNILAILAEYEAMLAVYFPQAFIKVVD